jgi:hypothetical protein
MKLGLASESLPSSRASRGRACEPWQALHGSSRHTSASFTGAYKHMQRMHGLQSVHVGSSHCEQSTIEESSTDLGPELEADCRIPSASGGRSENKEGSGGSARAYGGPARERAPRW